MRAGFPIATKGMVIGLLGGSFDPAHEGHVHITREALKRMGLDRVWWLVSPGNPLKARQPAPMAARLRQARRVMDDPRVVITDLEARLGTRATADTIDALQAIYPGVHFVWLMGADNLVQFHKWERWRDILRSVPVGVLVPLAESNRIEGTLLRNCTGPPSTRRTLRKAVSPALQLALPSGWQVQAPVGPVCTT